MVYPGPARNNAEGQFAGVRAAIAKATKGKKAAPAAAVAATPADTKTGSLQTPSSPPAGAFAPPPPRTTRALPAATDINNPTMSYAPSAKTGPAPLTAMPDASAAAKKSEAKKPQASAAKTAAAKPKKDTKKDTKSAASTTTTPKQP